MKKTIFLDIDGCIFKHKGNLSTQILENPTILPETIKKINEWNEAEHMIILVTGRKECMRKITENQLLSLGIYYDQLIMGVNRGERIIINDSKFDSDIITASAIQLTRNKGIRDVVI